MSVHFRGVCHSCKNVVCLVPCSTKWNKQQPNLVMKGQACQIEFKGDTITIS